MQKYSNIKTVCSSYFNVFGPRQDPNSQYSAVIPKFIAAMKKGEFSKIYGVRKQNKDFTNVVNMLEANMLACKTNGVSVEKL